MRSWPRILHAVMENYLKKVAVEGAVGDHICFQGATAKTDPWLLLLNKDLVKKYLFPLTVTHRSARSCTYAWRRKTC